MPLECRYSSPFTMPRVYRPIVGSSSGPRRTASASVPPGAYSMTRLKRGLRFSMLTWHPTVERILCSLCKGPARERSADLTARISPENRAVAVDTVAEDPWPMM
ncbi:molecular chaperone Hsp31 and glyoxalase 3 [Striga asiatica]|uniref:Molecular chaperone Hsp31 and glyoxalase 3 n=1 Tax=Striga asiatica TaxID=4170 RepID=A0A5A7R628_STRAF|nr:molecular chaperone Hsp31 and glyoxalase 3 [Striga asiatica]